MRKRIHVLVIVNAVFGYDGISSVATNYYLYQDKERIAMDLLTINSVPDSLAQIFVKNGDHLYVLPFRNSNPLKYLYSLYDIIKKNKYDLVHVHGNSATMAIELVAAKLANCPVRIAHSHNTQCDHIIINKLLMPLFSRLYTDCCACSKEAGQFLFGNRGCYVVNNGLYIPKYQFNPVTRERIRHELQLEGQFVIGHIGRFRFQKNQDYLISLLPKIRLKQENAVLLLIGSGENEQALKQQAREAGLEDMVLFYGTTDKVNEIVQAMDVFAFPSRFEGLGIVAIEAQASGLNCVASDAVPRMITIQDNVHFHPLEGSDDAWVRDLIAFYEPPEMRAEKADDTRKRLQAHCFDIEKNCRDMYHYYETILEQKRS